MDDFRTILQSTLQAGGFFAETDVLNQFCLHFELLCAANEEFNLTAITEFQAAAEKHYLDSLFAMDAMAAMAPGGRVLDIGSGAGFPGLILAIVRPDLQFTLIDATGKKCAFLEQCLSKLHLENVVVLNLRAEDAGRMIELRAAFDGVTARAVAPLPVLMEYAMPLLKTGGLLYALKGKGFENELDEAENALSTLFGRVENVYLREFPFSREGRSVLSIEKTAETPDKYPRRAGMPNKKPL